MAGNIKRHNKLKIFEKVKTAVIVCLCLSCIYLMYSIVSLESRLSGDGKINWFMSELTERTNLEGGTEVNPLTAFSVLSKPELIMINSGNSRYCVEEDNNNYNAITEAINTVIKNLYAPVAEFTKLDGYAEWDNAVKSNSIYIRYPCQRQTAFESQFYGMNNGDFVKSTKEYSELLMIFPATGDYVMVLIPVEDGVVRVKTKVTTSHINDIIKQQNNNNEKGYVFAGELNLDGPMSFNGHVTTASLSRTLIVPSVDEVTDNILLDVPWRYKNGISFTKTTEFMLRLIDVFGYNPNTIRQYSDMDGALVFVADTGTLRAHPNGKIEYKALTRNDGVPFTNQSKSGTGDAYTVTSGLLDIIDKVYQLCDEGQENNDIGIRFVSLPQMNQGEEMNFAIDYFVDGIKVELSSGHAITATVNRGVLTDLKMNIRTIKKTDGKTQSKPLFEAIDEFCAENPMSKKIVSAKKIYKANEVEQEICAEWEIKGVQER